MKAFVEGDERVEVGEWFSEELGEEYLRAFGRVAFLQDGR